VPWYCTSCGMPYRPNSKTRCTALGCNGMSAERWPPLDGFATLEPEGYNLTEEEELAVRGRWFDRKRNKED